MTQKGDLFKGHKKKKSIPPNRHGKIPHTKKGKRVMKSSKVTKEMDVDNELRKFINHCNEVKAATFATKDGGQLSIVKPQKIHQMPLPEASRNPCASCIIIIF